MPPNTQQILPFYPAYTFSSSPTFFIWAKLTCSTIHQDLHPHYSFPSNLLDAPTNGGPKPLLLFYLNHPIQFVQVCGIIVAIEDYHETHFLFTLDDSSGATIDVIFWKPRPKPADENNDGAANGIGGADKKSRDAAVDELNILSLLPTLHIGQCFQAKGTLTQFRGTRQLSLLRLAIIPTTSAEIKHIEARATFYETVLSKPWHLSPTKLKRLREKAEGDKDQDAEKAKKARKKERMKAEREVRHEKAIARAWQEEEKERERIAGEAKRAGEELMETIRKKRKVLIDMAEEDEDDD